MFTLKTEMTKGQHIQTLALSDSSPTASQMHN